MKLFEIGFLTLRLADLIDILLVALLLYGLFRLIRGSVAFNILIAIFVVYLLSIFFRAANMRLIGTILGQLISVGTIALVIIFQQEIRRFLFYFGKNRLVFTGGRFNWQLALPWNWRQPESPDINFEELAQACTRLSRSLTGAIIVLAPNSELRFFIATGVPIDGELTSKLLETIFMKNSPLHDGAAVLLKNRIRAAGCILPVSEIANLPAEFGLRHRSALGLAEQTDAMVIVVSEETGRISIASRGAIGPDLSEEKALGKRLFQEYYEIREG